MSALESKVGGAPLAAEATPVAEPAEPEPAEAEPLTGSVSRTPRPSLAPGLYLVATPIGNLEDITLRALRVLREADRIACEDTRQTQKLLNHFAIRTPTVSYHQHNEAGRAAELLAALRAGGRIAVVSDAGTPGIADPGTVLIREAITAGVPVFAIPGANAAINALVASGLPTERFHFLGFLPPREGQRRSALELLRAARLADRERSPAEPAATTILYEAPHRILDTLADVAAILGPAHPVVVARELTKVHEEMLRGTAAEVRDTLASRPSVRGEIVLLLTGDIASQAPATAESSTPGSLATSMRRLLAEGVDEKDALKRLARDRGLSKSEAYREWQRHRGR